MRAEKVAKTVKLTWQQSFVRPQGATVTTSTVYRVDGTTITPTNFADRKLVGQALLTTNFLVDSKPVTGKPVVYILYEDWSNGTRSGFVTVGFTYK